MSIQVLELTKTFGQQIAVDQISFEATKGQVVGFLGPNGAGKSTTMKIATGYISPTSGKVLICGEDMSANARSLKRKIGYLPEHNPLYTDMYVKEYLGMVASFYGFSGKKKSSKIGEMVESCGLDREQGKQISALSKGYRQRVGLAQAMIHDPEVLILDEPTSGLDPNQIIEIRSLIKTFSRDKTVLLSTHIMQEVKALCDQVVILNEGKIVANQSIDALSSAAERTFQLILAKPIADLEFPKLFGDVVVEGSAITFESTEDLRGQIFQWAASTGLPVLELKEVKHSIEDVFQKLTN